jgi:hypothetical protein
MAALKIANTTIKHSMRLLNVLLSSHPEGKTLYETTLQLGANSEQAFRSINSILSFNSMAAIGNSTRS